MSLILICIIGRGQINVGVKNDSLFSVPMNIFVEGDPWNNGYAYIDLDSNDSTDIKLVIIVVGGGEGTRIDSYFRCSDDTRIISDIVETYHMNDTTITPCAKKLDSNQIISNTDYDTTIAYLTRHSSVGGETFIHINHWADNLIHYVAFIKKINGKDYLGWIKIRVESGYQIYLYEWVMQEYAVGVPEFKYPTKILSTSYFNIFGQQIQKPKKGFYIERSLTNKGVVSKKYFQQ